MEPIFIPIQPTHQPQLGIGGEILNSTLKWVGILLAAVALGGGAIAAYGALFQQATNTNNGDLPEAELFTYTIGTTAYSDGDPIAWGTMTRGANTVTYSITNLLSDTPITVAILNGTLPTGWTLTASNTTILASSTASIPVTITVPETSPAGSYVWDTTVYAEA